MSSTSTFTASTRDFLLTKFYETHVINVHVFLVHNPFLTHPKCGFGWQTLATWHPSTNRTCIECVCGSQYCWFPAVESCIIQSAEVNLWLVLLSYRIYHRCQADNTQSPNRPSPTDAPMSSSSPPSPFTPTYLDDTAINVMLRACQTPETRDSGKSARKTSVCEKQRARSWGEGVRGPDRRKTRKVGTPISTVMQLFWVIHKLRHNGHRWSAVWTSCVQIQGIQHWWKTWKQGLLLLLASSQSKHCWSDEHMDRWQRWSNGFPTVWFWGAPLSV